MKTSILGLRTVIYNVSDLAKAKLWYTEAFQTKPYFDEVFYVGFNIAGYELGLHPEEKEFKVKTTNVITYWGVEDIEKEFQRFIRLGANVHQPPQNVGGDIVVAEVTDPWNNIIGLIYNPEFKLA